jgi:hypothetical protein
MLLLGASLSSVHQILGRTVQAGQTHFKRGQYLYLSHSTQVSIIPFA